MLADKLFGLASLFAVAGIVGIVAGYFGFALLCIGAIWLVTAGVWFEFKNSV